MNAQTTPPPATGIILAGGNSQRMGQDKALIEFGGKPLIAHVIERIRPLCTKLYIIANDPNGYAHFGEQVIADIVPGKGSLGGVYSGLVQASDPWVIAVACDMPFLNQELLRYQLSLAHQADAIVPHVAGVSGKSPHAGLGRSRNSSKPLAKTVDLHPMHAVYGKSCLSAMMERIQAGDLRLVSFFEQVRVRTVEQEEVDRFDPLHISVFNVNTAHDLEIAESLLAKHSPGI